MKKRHIIIFLLLLNLSVAIIKFAPNSMTLLNDKFKAFVRNGSNISEVNVFPKKGYGLNANDTVCTGNGHVVQEDNYSISFAGNGQVCDLYFDGANVNTYQILFDSNGGSLVNPVYREEGDPVGELPVPTKPGFHFDGWFDSRGTLVDSNYIMPRANLNVIAHWTVEKYTVTYDSACSGGITPSTTREYIYNTPIDLSLEAAKDGYEFKGWNESADSKAGLTSKLMPAEDITLCAQFKKTITVNFNANGNTISKTSDTCDMWNLDPSCSITSPTITAPANTPNVLGFSIGATNRTNSWSANTDKYVSTNATYYAQTRSNRSTFTATYLVGNGVESIGSSTNSCNTAYTYNGAAPKTTCNVTLPTITPLEGYENPLWSDGSAPSTVKTINGNITLTATATPKENTPYVVNHYTHNYGENIYTLESSENKTGTTDSTLTLANLKKTITGFTYSSGYANEGGTTKPTTTAPTTTTILANGSRVINLYYRPNYLYVQYDMNGGTLNTTGNYGTNGSLVTTSSTGTTTKFLRGFYGSKVGSVNTTTFATNTSSGLHDYNSPSSINIEKTGYAAVPGAQWNTKADGTGTSYNHATTTYDANGFGGANLATGNRTVTLYVNWEPVNYSITYNLDGGTNASSNPTSYNIESPNITLQDATKTGYTFLGWTGEGVTTPTKNLVIPTGSTGNRTYTANFTDNIVPVISSVTASTKWDQSNYVDFTATDSGSQIVGYNISTTNTAPTTWIPTNSFVEQLTETKYAYNAAWARVFHHNNHRGSVYFADANEAKSSNTNDKYSVLGNINNYKNSSNIWEYLLEYPDVNASGYNRWKQTANIITSSTANTTDGVKVAGYEAVGTPTWTGSRWGGLELSTATSSTFIDGSTGHSNWHYAIGAYVAYQGSMPGPGTNVGTVNLWTRIDDKTSTSKSSLTARLGDLRSNTKYYVWVKDANNNTASREVTTSKVDITNPGATITSTNNVAASQTGTLAITDNIGAVKYYWGTSNPNGANVTYTSINSSTSVNITKTISDSGTYYLGVVDDAGNRVIVNKTFYKTTLTPNRGTVSPSSVVTMSGNSFTIPTPSSVAGYTFNGWYTDSALTTSAGTTYKPTGNSTLYGKWTGKTYTATFYYQSNTASGSTTISSTTASCTVSNEEGTCEVTVPSAVTGSIGTYNNAYAGVTTSKDTMVNNKATKVTLSANATYYTAYSTKVTAYRPSSTSATTTQTYYRNQWFKSTSEMSTPVLATSDTGKTAGSNPTMVSGYSFTRFTTAVNNGGTAYNTLTALTNSNVTTAYVTESKTVTATFYYQSNTTSGSTTVSTTTATGTQLLYPSSTSAAVLNNGSITVPSAVTGSVGPYNTPYKGVASAVNSMSSANVNTGTTTYYAFYGGDQTASKVTVYRPSSTSACTNQQYYRNEMFTSTSAMKTVLSTSSTGNSNVNPTMVSGYTFKNLVTAASSTATTYTVESAAKTSTTTFYAWEQKTVTATFYYQSNTTSGSTAISTTTATGTQKLYCTSTSASTLNNGAITTPSVVTGSVGPYNRPYKGVASAVNSMSAASVNTGTTTYYAFYGGDQTASKVSVYRPSSTSATTLQQYYRNEVFTSTSAMKTVLSTSSTGTSNTTPTMVSGYSFSKLTTEVNNGGTGYSVENAAKTTTTTFYVTETKSVTATFYYCNSTSTANTTASGTQTLYPTSTSAATVSNGTISVPSAVSGSKGYGASYLGVASAVNSMSTASVNTGTTAYYAIYRASVNVYRPSSTTAATNQSYYRTVFASSTSSACNARLTTSSTGTSNTTPTMVSGYSFSSLRTAVNNGGTSYSLANAATTTTTTFYVTETKSVTATFYYYNGSAQTSTTASGTQTLYPTSTSAAKLVEGSISIPSAVSSSTGINSTTYKGVSSSTGSTTAATVNTSKTKYYAFYQKSVTFKATCTKGTGVSSISADSKSCSTTMSCTTNGTTYSTSGGTECTVTLPTITASSGYFNPKWSDGSASGASKKLTANVSLTASASLAYWQNTSSGTYYGANVSTAISGASAGNTLKLLQTYTDNTQGTQVGSTSSYYITVNKGIYVDLNGKTLTMSKSHLAFTSGTSYIYGSSGTITSALSTTLVIGSGSTVYIGTKDKKDGYNITIQNTASCGDGIVSKGGTLVIGGTSSTTGPNIVGSCYGILAAISGNWGGSGAARSITSYYAKVRTTATSSSSVAGIAVTDTSYKTTLSIQGTYVYGYGIGLQSNGNSSSTVSILNGYPGEAKIESKTSYAIHHSAGTMTIGSGTTTGTGETQAKIAGYSTSASTIYQTGGTINYQTNAGSYGKGANNSVFPIYLAGGTMNLQGGVIRSLQTSSSFKRTNGTLNITGSRGQASGSGSYSSWNGQGTLSTTYYNYRKS